MGLFARENTVHLPPNSLNELRSEKPRKFVLSFVSLLTIHTARSIVDVDRSRKSTVVRFQF